ncbi:NTP transferase domain-containing protein [Gellertiella hungarica]|uniref:Molybdenum cofactor cytidylyltransferase n=1 Tax=Gellertiella hungarica TaxID=1572859 RepID=A0A7W6NKQ6_9HYPH|nr:molybdopterin-binding/glycosyltransferase family 2 protein [Gellertiella hungarica]MBB4064660.1 molybdenum cofactor cytidylyltransferase [Gellertiella hungarica]
MRFGSFSLTEGEGLVLAHSVRVADLSFPKGHRLTQGEAERLQACGVNEVIAVRLEPGDLGEDAAAQRIASAFPGSHHRVTQAATGRVNVHATANGLFIADREAVHRLNRIDPAITFACLESHVPVADGEMVGTVKIIPLAVAESRVAEAEGLLAGSRPFDVLPFRPHAVTLIATELPGLKPSVMDKTARVLARRLHPSGSSIVREIRVPHRAEAVAAVIRTPVGERERDRLVVIFGASALTDFDDVIPAAVRAAGGRVIHAGLPVDPGNLLVLGEVAGVPVIGAPGCARSPAENGFDWVLNRILAGRMPEPDDLTGWGVGGLLKEIPIRPSPREATEPPPEKLRVAGLVLAAGRASRMGNGGHKLLAEFSGEPLVRRSTRIVQQGRVDCVAVVTGFRAEEIRAALGGLGAVIAHNPDYTSGMASSLATGLDLPAVADADGVLVMLADMPGVSANDIGTLVDTFRAEGGRAVVRAVSAGKRGNPVVLPKALFPALRRLEGDSGARTIIETSGLPVVDVEIGEAAHLDVDTPEAVLEAGGILKG